MNIFRRIIGKRIINRTSVVIDFSYHYNIALLYDFDSHENARKFFDSVNLDRRMIRSLLKVKICRHKQSEISIEDLIGYYEHCPECNNAIYHYSETIEEQNIRLNGVRKRVLKHEIEELELEVNIKRKELNEIENET